MHPTDALNATLGMNATPSLAGLRYITSPPHCIRNLITHPGLRLGHACEVLLLKLSFVSDAKILANGSTSENTSDDHCAGGSSGGLIRLQGDKVRQQLVEYKKVLSWFYDEFLAVWKYIRLSTRV